MIVVVLLVIYLLAYAAEVIWRFIPEPEQAQAQVVDRSIQKTSGGRAATNVNAIKSLKLFGDATQVVVEEKPVVQEAPETNLNLTLTGLVASTTETNGAAIIENKGQQNTYGIGEKVDGTRAIVKEVQRDRIIIDNGGRFETLMLDGHDFSAKSGTASTRPEPKTETRDRKVVGKPGPSGRNPAARKFDSEKAEMARALRNSPTKFTDFISIAPSRQGGKIVGYKVNPGKDPSLFKAAGLKPNDVLTEINGLDLTDVRQSMEAMNMLRNADFLQLTVSRNGDLTSLDLELPSPDEN